MHVKLNPTYYTNSETALRQVHLFYELAKQCGIKHASITAGCDQFSTLDTIVSM